MRQSLMVVWRDRTLLAFPMLSTSVILVTLWMFYLSVGNDKIQLFVNTRVNAIGVQTLNTGYYLVIFIAYLLLCFVTTFCNLALTYAAYISMNERDSKYRDGIQAGVRSIFSLLVWTLFNSTIGVLFTLLDQQKTTSRLLRNVLRSDWSTMTYFVIPIMAVERKSIFASLPRSSQIMAERSGKSVSAIIGLGWFLLLLNIPVLVFLLIEWYFALLSPFIFLLSISWTLFALILATAAKQVLTVVLYLYASNGETPNGWDPESLRQSFTGSVSLPATTADETAADVNATTADVPENKD